jgi:hypothetical protein
VAVIVVADPTVNEGDGLVPNSTLVALVRFAPVMVTCVPPAVVPDVGLMPVTVGLGARNVNTAAAPVALVPSGVVTVTSTGPADCAGAVAVIDVSELTVKAAAVEPKSTLVAPVKSIPVIVTVVPPVANPERGVIPVTVGVGITKWNVVCAVPVLVPSGVVTVTSSAPAASAGEVAVIDVSEFTTNVAEVEPKSTAVAPVKPVPVIVTDVPPAVDPERGLIPVTVGAGPM